MRGEIIYIRNVYTIENHPVSGDHAFGFLSGFQFRPHPVMMILLFSLLQVTTCTVISYYHILSVYTDILSLCTACCLPAVYLLYSSLWSGCCRRSAAVCVVQIAATWSVIPVSVPGSFRATRHITLTYIQIVQAHLIFTGYSSCISCIYYIIHCLLRVLHNCYNVMTRCNVSLKFCTLCRC